MLGWSSLCTASLVIRSIYRDILLSDTMRPVEATVCYYPMQNSTQLEERQHNSRILSPKSSFAERGKPIFLGGMPTHVVLKIHVCRNVTSYRLENRRRVVTVQEPWIVIKTVVTTSDIVYLYTFLLVRFKVLVTQRKYRDEIFLWPCAPLQWLIGHPSNISLTSEVLSPYRAPKNSSVKQHHPAVEAYSENHRDFHLHPILVPGQHACFPVASGPDLGADRNIHLYDMPTLYVINIFFNFDSRSF